MTGAGGGGPRGRIQLYPDNRIMAAGGARDASSPTETNGLTGYALKVCAGAASAGLLFGYAIGITGGISSMNDHRILEPFSPTINVADNFSGNDYCQYGNHIPRLIMSSLYLAGMVGAGIASFLTASRGRRPSMAVAAIILACGTMISAISQNIAMFIIGRAFLGLALGFGFQSIPLYLTEMAPPIHRGCLNMMFQLAINIGLLSADLIMYGATKMHLWGWQFSSRIASIPALFLVLGFLLLPETPVSLIWHGKIIEAEETLKKIRQTVEVSEEYQDLVDATIAAREVQVLYRPHSNFYVIGALFEEKHRPHLIMAMLLPFSQVATGISAIFLYGPHLLDLIGFSENASLYSAIMIGFISSLSIMVSMAFVDRVGRKILLFAGGMQMFVCQVVMGVLLKYDEEMQQGSLSKSTACGVLALLTTCVAAYGLSWGSVGWTVPSEMLPLEIRSSGQSLSVCINFFCSFCMAQVIPLMICTFQHLTFLYFAGWILIVTSIMCGLLPETSGVPSEGMVKLWHRHWFWGKYFLL